VDTGSGGTAWLFAAFGWANGIANDGRPMSEELASGVGGRIVTKVATLRSFDFGGFELTGLPASFSKDNQADHVHSGYVAGDLGAAIFRRFRLVFDMSRGELHVEPGPEWNKPWSKDRLGLGRVFRDGKLIVEFVAPGSPAAKAGWSKGDTITHIDGKPVTADLWREMRSRADVPVGTEVVLTDGNGKERKLVAADYY
jgi:hypothetical protein